MLKDCFLAIDKNTKNKGRKKDKEVMRRKEKVVRTKEPFAGGGARARYQLAFCRYKSSPGVGCRPGFR